MVNDHALDTRTELADVKRRLRALELLLQVEASQPLSMSELENAYVRAPALLTRPTLGPKLAQLWSTLSLRLSTTQLLELARTLGAPFPWVPFLRVMRRARAEHPSNDTIAADEHLTAVVRDLLDAQGLGILDPEDMFGTPHALERAVDFMIRRDRP